MALRDRLDPFALAATIDRKIERLVTLATTPRPHPTPVPPEDHVQASPRRRRPGRPAHVKDFTFANNLRRPLPWPTRVTC
jgi:hypothetical protein